MMDDTASYILESLREMAWERAKGELSSIKAAMWSAEGEKQAKKNARVAEAINEFIEKMEQEVL